MTSHFCASCRAAALISFAILFLLIPSLSHGQGTQADYDRANNLRRATSGKVRNGRIKIEQIRGTSAFWYNRDLGNRQFQIRLVVPENGTNEAAFDHDAVAKALADKTERTVNAKSLPMKTLLFSEDLKSIFFEAFEKKWSMNIVDPDSLSEIDTFPKRPVKTEPFPKNSSFSRRSDQSPDKNWQTFVRDFNLYLRNTDSKDEFPLTTDGNAGDYFDARVFWSPNSAKLVALRIKRGEDHRIYFVESSPKDQVQPKLHNRRYLKPGDNIPLTRPKLFDVASKMQIEVNEDLFPNPYGVKEFRWKPDSSEFTFYYNQRGHQVVKIIGIDAATGKTRAIIHEQSETFVDYAYKHFTHYLDATDEMIWMSERDGWNHLYLVDAATGNVKNQITEGDWVVRGVDWVDADRRQLWLRVSGIDPAQDPYYIHYVRINFDGSNLIRITDGDGTHKAAFSPDREFLLDSYSRVDLAPVVEIRRTSDGAKVCDVERADWTELIATGWKPPTRFVAKGRDGKTDIHGVIYWPSTFDENKSYPVIEDIYAGPHGSFVPKEFNPSRRGQALAELGFIVVRCDGMGTSNRSKAFHNVAWKNLADSGFPDRILWIKAAAEKYPQMDTSRVGIFGGSAGGQSTVRALIAHNDFYKVAVADCGCHDNRMDKIWWNELWMSWPIGPHYKEQSNVTQAHRLKGKLFLTVGEMDTNVDPASTMQVVDALIKADKDFDLLVVPGAGHGVGERPYPKRRRRDFFVRHLLGVEPRAN